MKKFPIGLIFLLFTSLFADLPYEELYKEGELYFLEKEWQKAIFTLEQVQPKRNFDLAPWAENSSKILLEAYLHLIEDERIFPLLQKETLRKASDLLQQIKTTFPSLNVTYSEILLLHAQGNFALAKDLLQKSSLPWQQRGELQILLNENALKTVEAPYLQKGGLATKEEALLYATALFNANELEKSEKILLNLNVSPPPFLLGTLYYRQRKFEQAATIFHTIAKENTKEAPSALYWAARAEEEVPSLRKKARVTYQELYNRYKDSPLSPEGYFFSYSLGEYLQGEKAAKKHLENFKSLFPNSPLILYVYYIQGLDQLRDRKGDGHKAISKRDLIGAIDSFQEVENNFERLKNLGAIQVDEKEKWEALRSLSALEKGKTNFEIGLESRSPKKEIYLTYAVEVLGDLSSDEALYYKGRALEEGGSYSLASQIYRDLLLKNPGLPLTAKANIRLGWIAKKEKLNTKALQCFDEALNLFNSSPHCLETDELLELMIDRSLTLVEEGRLDDAMKQLTAVINYEAISPLRLKAMYLRADLYQLEGRKILARKQLESLALKGGPWAEQAKQKLENEYGFN